jgi:predicted O-linked N-acetylglucosamine transferase (SPINDLY family)
MPDLEQAKQLFYDALEANRLKDYGRMASLLEQARVIAPDRVSVLTNLSAALLKLGRAEEAGMHAAKSVAIDPENVDGWINAGNACGELKRFDDALRHYDRAVQIDSASADAWMNRGVALQALQQFNEAQACYSRVLTLAPDNPEAHRNLGNLLSILKQYDKALASYNEALKRDADDARIYDNRGDLLLTTGSRVAALHDFSEAIRLEPGASIHRLKHWIAGIPIIPVDQAECELSRSSLAAEALQLLDWINAKSPQDGHQAVGSIQPFYLAYQETNNRELLQSYGAICTALMGPWQKKLPLPESRSTRAASSQIRVGIVSAQMKNHSVWNALVKGWVKWLDKSRFDLQLFHLSADSDRETEFAKAHASAFLGGNKPLQEWVDLVAEAAPDVLIYPDLCLDSMAVLLASLRLAPVQVAAWGHPETTGLPTLDYYLSGADFETTQSQQNYSEKLIPLAGLGCCYDPVPVPEAEFDMRELGIEAGCTTFICAGTPYKYAPEHDAVFTQIARKVPDAVFLFFTHGDAPPLSARLFDRIASRFAFEGLDFAHHVRVVPWQPKLLFYALLRQADVYLDTIGFSGFNTAMQAVECGLPIVTREGRFMRGRFASAILKRMRLDELVVHDNESYVDCAIRLARDTQYREGIRKKIEMARGALYGDRSSINALEVFLLDVTKHNET